MRKLLTKNEVADLMNIPRSQIRFYQKKGLISPIQSENGYGYYDTYHLEKIEFILFLRSLDKTIEEIKEILNKDYLYSYQDILIEAEEEVKKKQKELRRKLKDIQYKKEYFKQTTPYDYLYLEMDYRVVHLSESPVNNLSIKDVYHLMKEHNVDYFDFDNELCEINDNGQIIMGLINSKVDDAYEAVEQYVLPKGTYLSYSFEIKESGDYRKHLNIFTSECKNRDIDTSIIVTINNFAKPYYTKHYSMFTLQVKL